MSSPFADNPEEVTKLLEAAHVKAAASGTTKEEVLAAAAAARNIPPHHPDATTGEEAYRCTKLCFHLSLSRFLSSSAGNTSPHPGRATVRESTEAQLLCLPNQG